MISPAAEIDYLQFYNTESEIKISETIQHLQYREEALMAKKSETMPASRNKIENSMRTTSLSKGSTAWKKS